MDLKWLARSIIVCFCTAHLYAITGNWFGNGYEMEVNASSSSAPVKRVSGTFVISGQNGSFTLGMLGDSGDDLITLSYVKQGNRYVAQDREPFEEGGFPMIRFRRSEITELDSETLTVNFAEAEYQGEGEFPDMLYFASFVGVLTKAPLPEADAAQWAGTYGIWGNCLEASDGERALIALAPSIERVTVVSNANSYIVDDEIVFTPAGDALVHSEISNTRQIFPINDDVDSEHLFTSEQDRALQIGRGRIAVFTLSAKIHRLRGKTNPIIYGDPFIQFAEGCIYISPPCAPMPVWTDNNGTKQHSGYGWTFESEVSSDRGLILKNIYLTGRLMAEEISLPYILIETTELREARITLARDKTVDGVTVRLIEVKESLGSENGRGFLQVEGVYGIFRAGASCITVTQRYKFCARVTGERLEPSGTLKGQRFFPEVAYDFTSVDGEKLTALQAVQRLRFKVDGNEMQRGGLFVDTLNPGSPVSPAVGDSNTLSEEAGLSAVVNGGIGSAHNFHQTFNHTVHLPGAGRLAGCTECVHVHWYWGFLAHVPRLLFEGLEITPFTIRSPIIPPDSNQDVQIAYVAPPVPSGNSWTLAELLRPLGSMPMSGGDFYYSSKGKRASDRFFIHGGFFATELIEFSQPAKYYGPLSGDIQVFVERPSAAGQTVSVDYYTEDGSGIAGLNYVASRGSITFGPGETRKAITIRRLTGGLNGETFFVRLEKPTRGALLGDSPITKVILGVDLRSPPILRFGSGVGGLLRQQNANARGLTFQIESESATVVVEHSFDAVNWTETFRTRKPSGSISQSITLDDLPPGSYCLFRAYLLPE